MIQKLMINVESDKPLSKCGNNHVLLYDERKGRYYVTTKKALFEEQDQKIARMELELKDFEDKVKTEEEKLMNELEIWKKEFLSKYAETNSALIQMVKNVVVKEE